MYAYQQYAPTQQTRRSGIDAASWALIALVVALICAGAGWAIASKRVMSQGELQDQSILASREGAARGMQDGYRDGAKVGRREEGLRARLDLQRSKRGAVQDGFNTGFNDGRARTEARSSGFDALAMSSLGSYPSMGYSDALSSGLFDDEPGYSTSSYSSYGYGANVGSTYATSGSSYASGSLGLGY